MNNDPMLEFLESGTFSGLTEVNEIRVQALDLFDRCLTEGNRTPMVAFLERQLLTDPPDIQLLQEIANDLQQRLIALRASHYDSRTSVVRIFAEKYSVDITPLAPAAALNEYHQLDANQLVLYVQKCIGHLSPEDKHSLTGLVQDSLKMAIRLHGDIQMTLELQQMLLDWVEGLSATIGRRYWPEITLPDIYSQ